jgi:hypothetical protein
MDIFSTVGQEINYPVGHRFVPVPSIKLTTLKQYDWQWHMFGHGQVVLWPILEKLRRYSCA